MLLCEELFPQPSENCSENCLAAVLLLLRPRSHAAAEGASLSMQTHTIGLYKQAFSFIQQVGHTSMSGNSL